MSVANTIATKLPLEYKVIGLAMQGILSPAMSEIRSHNDEAWSSFGEYTRDAARRFQLMTGLTMPELEELYDQYNKGKITGYDIRKLLKKRLEEKKNAEAEDAEELKMLIDPSGYVYEAVASNRIVDAVATLYSEGMEFWNAEAFEQMNPLITDKEGKYAWDVPEGNWFVKVFKEGYEEGSSDNDPAAVVTIGGINYLPVLPPQLDVNIPLVSYSKPMASIEKIGNDICLVFGKYVDVATVTSDTVKLSGLASSDYTLTALDAEVSPAHTPICGGKTLGRTFRVDIKNGNATQRIEAEITEAVMGYNGISAKGKAIYGKENGTADPNGSFLDPGNTISENTTPETVIPKKSKTGLIVGIIIGFAVLAGGAAAFVLWRKKRSEPTGTHGTGLGVHFAYAFDRGLGDVHDPGDLVECKAIGSKILRISVPLYFSQSSDLGCGG